jgi:hypothetical protein
METEGLDGFSFQQTDRLAPAHLLLNDYVAEPVMDFERFVPDAKWKKLPKRQTIDLIEAMLQRITWLIERDSELRDAHVSRLKLIKLLRQLYARKLPCNDTDLRMMLDLTVPLLNHIAPDGPVDYVMEYVKENDLTPELCCSLHNFQENLVEVGSVASMQSLRQRLHTLLFMDEWEPLNPAHCWSESIRRDFRAMTGDRRSNWRQLLKHIRGNAPSNMPASWARDAETFLAAVGVDDFVEQLSLWFAPFRSGQPLPLSVAGSHILKGLIWYVAVSRDGHAREIALWLLDVKWKQKKNMTKSMVALGVLGISKEELLSRGLIREPKTPSPRILERMIEIFKAPNVNTHIVADQDGDLIVVQGQLHFYRLFRSTGRIERVSDNATLELNWTAISDSERLYLRPECDSDDQLHRRAAMLMLDSIYGGYFKVARQ